KFPGMKARGHEIVARAFGRRRREDRRLEFEKALLLHAPPQRIDDLTALHDVLMQVLAAQIEETVTKPDVLGIFLLAEHRHRQFGSPAQDLDLANVDFD